MWEYGFLLTHILPCMEKILDSDPTRENTGHWKLASLHILCDVNFVEMVMVKARNPQNSCKI